MKSDNGLRNWWKKLQLLVEKTESRFLRSGRRRLKLNKSGRWYVALTIGLGVAAMGSGNNILYLLESFLMGGLILSGVLSEWTIASVKVQPHFRQAIAGEKVLDDWIVENKRNVPLFGIEIGFLTEEEKFIFAAFVPILPARKRLQIRSAHAFSERGKFSWKGFVVQTRYPFGFTTKLRWDVSAGERIIWPEWEKSRNTNLWSQGQQHRGWLEHLEGEVREFQDGDDYRDIIWSQSLKSSQKLKRARGSSAQELIFNMDLTQLDEAKLENAIRQICHRIYEAADVDRVYLSVNTSSAMEVYEGKKKVLDYLAIVTIGERG